MSKFEVDSVLQEIKEANKTGDFNTRMEGNRRAVVFYVDKGDRNLGYIPWWTFTWKQIGLDSEKEAFDIILMTHPSSVNKLPKECIPVPSDFDPTAKGPGRCLWVELTPISERDPRYYNHLNSLECLANPAADFLLKYRTLLRADQDTFPTPGMLGFWPTDLICSRRAGTTHHLPSIENALIETAKAAGIVHHHWHNTDSAMMGPAHRVVAVSKLTTVLARFVKATLFGPGTMCRCATCVQPPKECYWGKGIFAGTLLLYTQEIAMNHIWTQREYDEQNYNKLDVGTTREDIHICVPAVLHARHNANPFSKNGFFDNKYRAYDMSNLTITNLRDYAIYMALTPTNMGTGGKLAWSRYLEAKKKPLSEVCQGKVWEPCVHC